MIVLRVFNKEWIEKSSFWAASGRLIACRSVIDNDPAELPRFVLHKQHSIDGIEDLMTSAAIVS